MALSPNYGWAEPDNSSLVKNGAQDIRALGDAIDTSVWNVGYGQAGKNKIINGDFGIWQRGTSFSANTYSADRWVSLTDATVTSSQQSFTAGTAPVAGYEGQYFLRTAKSAGGSYVIQEQRVEDVRDFAGQPVTVSFWAKADATVTTAPVIVQFFGSGGSASVDTSLTSAVLTTSWVRYSMTVTLPSIAGKTIGAGNYLSVRPVRAITASATTIDIWGVQLEYGSKATPFQTASGGSPQAEFAMCQRYYYRESTGAAYGSRGFGIASSTTNVATLFNLPVQMRVTPTAIEYANLSVQLPGTGAYAVSSIGLDTGVATKNTLGMNVTTSGITKSQTYYLANDNNVNGYLGASAEL
jgi:hypothetical protein